jgi:hypothetical protein
MEFYYAIKEKFYVILFFLLSYFIFGCYNFIDFLIGELNMNQNLKTPVEQINNNRQTNCEKKFDYFQNLFTERSHDLVEGKYKNIRSTVILYCTHHNKTQTTTFFNYGRCKNGLRCCGLAQIPKRTYWLTGRVGPNHPAYKHGLGKKTREYNPHIYNTWILGIHIKFNFKCFVTQETKNLECHHLEGWWYKIGRFDLRNGVLLSKHIHQDFHNKFGRGHNTTNQFEKYLFEKHKILNYPWRDENHQPSLSIEQISYCQKTEREKRFIYFQNLFTKRGHDLVKGESKNIHSKVLLYCTHHNKTQTTTFLNYGRCKNGLRCCGLAQQKTKAHSNVRDTKTGRFRDSTLENEI